MSTLHDMPHGIEVVGILGAGTIGASWTALFLAAGLEVDVYDPSPEGEAFVRDYVRHAWPSLERLGLARRGDPGRLRFVATPEEAVARAQFVQESVPERIDVKHALYRRIENHLDPRAIVCSSASGLLVKEMQAGWKNPGRFILGHPFNPPHLIPLVELLGNEKTEPGVLALAEQFYAACGKITIRVNKEVPGHVANRLQAALWREAIHLVVEGVATVGDVDKAVSAGPGLRWSVMGPHMLFNLGSGGHGLGVFCERFAPSFHRWWDDLGHPTLDPQTIRMLVDGVKAEEDGRQFHDLAAERDRKIVEASKAIMEAAYPTRAIDVVGERKVAAR
ncbi:3-hydroxyacyl-CoA dehydrogenase NAD-binding domain-containing protein [Burkholderia aenigmatica]|uniref:3-hydroxyacyl-CoA dehydrogenase NAD-binding domain-containing protein n=1 Tax=Burkholderia aenigmatica TaxID=2015348 RepID=UPI001F3B63A5|nr:3-hydroxyacyl-CoA dehydrogenase NAD-binding domain-containing protein [Burkholderia aenigmatica]UKD16624.1 3-hydroxyacyl-CoA dehydrogenase NAD-binding domain-containing protein [Burkholderia aenigmatica]